MDKPDDYTVVFNLTEGNSRFHAVFTVRWNACFMMPKHIFEAQDDPLAYTFNPVVSLGPYVINSYDPNGDWFIWERREDWERTTLARFGEPAPKYAMYISPGPSDKKVIAQTAGDLDVIHDMAPEGQITLATDEPDIQELVPFLPVGAPGSYAACRYLQQRKARAGQPRYSLGVDTGDRHRARGHGFVPWRGHDLCDSRPADRLVSTILLRPGAGLAERL